MKIYLAGPDVFRLDLAEWQRAVIEACARHGHAPLFPCDNECAHPIGLVEANLAMIRQADVVVANMNPFRGVEPDSGAVFEVGYAVALGKPVIAYVATREDVLDKVFRMYSRATVSEGAFRWRDKDGHGIEDAGQPLNLMLAHTVMEIVYGSVEHALDHVMGGNAMLLP